MVGGVWFPNWDNLELMINSTSKFNLSLVHRYGEDNKKRAEYIFTRMIYICENLCDIHPYVTLEQLENSIRTSKYAVSFC